MAKNFTRTIEDFICENCGHTVEGDGFTNHCPICLYSKHVDVNPGDREEKCGGLMKPEKIEFAEGEYIILHKCLKCGFERRQRMEEKDNFDEAIRISKENSLKN